jgi:hypothetical protein
MTLTDDRPDDRLPAPTHCRSCGALIWWRVNPSGARQPFNWDASRLSPTDVPHHATCPDGRAWRRR